MNISTLNILVGIIGTLIGLLISSMEVKNQERKAFKEETTEFAALQSDIKYIRELSEKNSKEIGEVNKSVAQANEKIARIDERVNIIIPIIRSNE